MFHQKLDKYKKSCSEKYLKEECYHYRLDDLYEPDDTIQYEYDKDQLICYNNITILYDEEGNLKQDQDHSLVWNKRHELKFYDETTFYYNAEGLRIKKSSNNYYYDEQERLLKESRGIEYYYDREGLIGLSYKGKYYFYVKDILGNVKAIVSNTGDIQARYCYDAWGNHIVEDSEGNIITDQEHIGNVNPFRYRSYYYDNETELYYLKSRYYNPKTGRFISKDNINYIEPMTVNGLNLYNYCFNNPITYIDPDGTFSIVGLIIGTIIGAAVGFGITAYEDYKDDGKVFNGSIGWQTYLGATLVGGAGGGLLGGYVLPALRHIPTGLKVLTDTAGFSNIIVAGSGTIVGGKAIAGAGTLAALGGLTYMFWNIPKQGKPNTTIKHGSSYGEYDSNGNLKYRVDTTHSHYIKKYGQKYQPHIHKFTWKLVNGIWRFIEEIFPYL